ncbi:MAG: LytTR family DNA-binding domain-containing protein, partial [Bacteroidota bacterium]
INKDKLIDTVNKIERSQDEKFNVGTLNKILDSINQLSSPKPNIALPTSEGLEFILINEIIYAAADGNYTYVHLQNGKKILLSKLLKDIEELLQGHHFIRIHQSYLINVSHVKKYYKGKGGYVVMSNGDSLNVSRSLKSNFLSRI